MTAEILSFETGRPAEIADGEPALVVLDEPNSNLDADGDAALAQALTGLKARGATAVIISHRVLIGQMDAALVLRDGAVQAFGPAAEVLAGLQRSRDTGQAGNFAGRAIP